MYRYRECGLDDVWLVNGFKKSRGPYGPTVAIDDTPKLHAAIAARLAAKQGRLLPGELRFLRKALGLSQSALGDLIGADMQAIARWEKGQTAVPGMADRLVRAFFLEHVGDDVDLRAIAARLRDSETRPAKIAFRRGRSSWRAA